MIVCGHLPYIQVANVQASTQAAHSQVCHSMDKKYKLSAVLICDSLSTTYTFNTANSTITSLCYNYPHHQEHQTELLEESSLEGQ